MKAHIRCVEITVADAKPEELLKLLIEICETNAGSIPEWHGGGGGPGMPAPED